LFLVLRLFSGSPYYQLGGDQCTFLELARTFPKHQLFNHELYLIHSPLFGYAIALLHVVLPLLVSGLAAVLLFACANFFALRALGQIENLPKSALIVGLMYLAMSRPARLTTIMWREFPSWSVPTRRRCSRFYACWKSRTGRTF
jgi:hypothetical protein